MGCGMGRRWGPRQPTLLAAGLFALAACGGEPPLTLEFTPDGFETEAGDTVQGESARLVVPERHDNPTGPGIELALARFPTTSDDPGPRPYASLVPSGEYCGSQYRSVSCVRTVHPNSSPPPHATMTATAARDRSGGC